MGSGRSRTVQPAGYGGFYDPYYNTYGSGLEYYDPSTFRCKNLVTLFTELALMKLLSLAYGPTYGPGGVMTGYVTTAIVPAAPLVSPGRGFGALGGGLGGFGNVPPKIRAIFIPQGGFGGVPANPW